MHKFVFFMVAIFIGMSLHPGDAEARRMSGGGSFGMKRQLSPAPRQQARPQAAPQASAAAAGQAAKPRSSWMGPIAGIAAGLGLAALASHLGFGEQLANIMTILLIGFIIMAVIGFVMRKKLANAPAMQYAGGQGAGAGQGGFGQSKLSELLASAGAAQGSTATQEAAYAGQAGNFPADFDEQAFVRNAKVSFIRLQAANDAGNLDDIRDFTTPEVFAEIRLQHAERNGTTQETDVVHVDAEVLDVTQEEKRIIASVVFRGQIREERNGPVEDFAEVWHMTKPLDDSYGWVIAGIEQVQ